MSDIGPGTMVVCIDDLWIGRHDVPMPICPINGVIYTVREFDPVPDPGYPGVSFIRLEEIRNPPEPNRLEASFDIRQFRPVKRTSIESLRALLNPIREVDLA